MMQMFQTNYITTVILTSFPSANQNSSNLHNYHLIIHKNPFTPPSNRIFFAHPAEKSVSSAHNRSTYKSRPTSFQPRAKHTHTALARAPVAFLPYPTHNNIVARASVSFLRPSPPFCLPLTRASSRAIRFFCWLNNRAGRGERKSQWKCTRALTTNLLGQMFLRAGIVFFSSPSCIRFASSRER